MYRYCLRVLEQRSGSLDAHCDRFFENYLRKSFESQHNIADHSLLNSNYFNKLSWIKILLLIQPVNYCTQVLLLRIQIKNPVNLKTTLPVNKFQRKLFSICLLKKFQETSYQSIQSNQQISKLVFKSESRYVNIAHHDLLLSTNKFQ